jgi:nucleoid-associated protein YgaU
MSLAIVGIVTTAGRGQETATVVSHRYTVRPGDTLWSIARFQVGPSGDPRPVIEDIRQANALDAAATVSPGATLVLP